MKKFISIVLLILIFQPVMAQELTPPAEALPRMVERLEILVIMADVFADCTVALVEFMYHGIGEFFLDFIITSIKLYKDCFWMFYRIWGVSCSIFDCCYDIVQFVCGICSILPFIGGIPALFMVLLIDLPRDFCDIILAFCFLCITIFDLIAGALKGVKGWLGEGGE